MFSPIQFAMQMIQRNPQISNNPTAQQYLQIIQNGDSTKGEQIADNILKSYGMNREQGINQALGFFGFKR